MRATLAKLCIMARINLQTELGISRIGELCLYPLHNTDVIIHMGIVFEAFILRLRQRILYRLFRVN
ncbi:MAG: hypothetical protein CMM94_00985 [Rickettsiales bacterium]|nr:hypothetical protein [Rickettsiales bacterium]